MRARTRMICFFAALLAAGCQRASVEDLRDPKAIEARDARDSAPPRLVKRVLVPVEGAPTQGERSAPVTIVAFTDFQCPFSARGMATMAELRRQYGKNVRLAMHHLPLLSHARARDAALAAIAAGEQGRFWPMHDKLFANTRDLESADLLGFAKELGLDPAQWLTDVAAKPTQEALDRDVALAQKLGVHSAPTFFVNGRRIEGAQPLDTFRALVDEEVAHAEQLVKAGTTPEAVYAELTRPGAAPAPALVAPVGDEPGCGCKGAPDSDAPVVGKEREVIHEGASPTRGTAGAPVTITIFSDFQCPFCARAEPRILGLEAQFPGKIRYVFKHQPLPMHDNARSAAKASLAAAEQGKFWEFHDVLFASKKLDRIDLEQAATRVGLDLGAFHAALDGTALDARLVADAGEANRLGVQGTPTFFINGRRVIGAQPTEVFVRVIEEELSSAL